MSFLTVARTSRPVNVYLKHYLRRLSSGRLRTFSGIIDSSRKVGHFIQNDLSKSHIHMSASRLKSHYENWAYLSHEDLEALIESGDLQLIDIREEKEIEEQGEFPMAINIPLQDLKKALQMTDEAFEEKYRASKPQQKDTNIVFAGFKSVKSSAALEIAHKLGFKKARQYKNGFDEWKDVYADYKRAGAS